MGEISVSRVFRLNSQIGFLCKKAHFADILIMKKKNLSLHPLKYLKIHICLYGI